MNTKANLLALLIMLLVTLGVNHGLDAQVEAPALTTDARLVPVDRIVRDGMVYDLYYPADEEGAPQVVNVTRENLEVEALRQKVAINRLEIQLKTEMVFAAASGKRW